MSLRLGEVAGRAEHDEHRRGRHLVARRLGQRVGPRLTSVPASRSAFLRSVSMSSSNDLANEATPSSSSTRPTSRHVDADRRERGHDAGGLVDALVDRAGDATVVLERLDRALGHGVDGVGPDEVVDVERVGVVGVLRRRRRPQRPLHPAPRGRRARCQRSPEKRSRNSWYASLAWATAALPRSASASRRADGVEAAIDLGVDPADEERRHAVHRAPGRRRRPRGPRGTPR